MKTQRQPRAKPIGYSTICSSLRQQILDGTLAAGQQLPTHVELVQQFHSTPPTVSRALSVLQRHGFIRTQQRQGMFVVEKLPHLTNYAVVFHNDPQDPKLWSKYYAALIESARQAEQTEGRHFQFFYNIHEHRDTEDYQRLYHLVTTHQVAGMIFANYPHELEGSPLIDEPGIPRVALANQSYSPLVPVVGFDGDGVLRRALDYLVAHRRSRIAVLDIELSADEDRARARVLAEHGLAAPAYWRQSISRQHPFGARNCVELLFQGPRRTRPDGLIIADDNLVEHGLAGLVAAGVQVPADVEVVTHCNFAQPTTSVVPVTRLGYDIHRVLSCAIDLIDRQRRGEAVPGRTTIPAVFESDLQTELTVLPRTDKRDR